MCGIVGAVGYLNAQILESVAEMNQHQSHRGPDGAGIWTSGINERYGVSFGHRRLAIIDLSTSANQPMVDASTGNSLVFNGEIYNYLELKTELEKASIIFQTNSDTEVILHAYRIWGKEFVKRLRGMFSIVIWDETNRQIIMYRDRLGIKPLYYTIINQQSEQTLLFASEIKTLLKSGLVNRKLNPAGVESFIWNGFVAGGETTVVKDIYQVQAAHQIEFNERGNILNNEEFWQFPVYKPETESTSLEAVKEELALSTKIHLASDVPLGVFLSGGIDSSAVAALAVKQGHSQISTYNLAFDEVEYSEAEYAKAVANALGTDHHEVILTQAEFLNSLDDAMHSMDQPSFDGINTYFISREIRKAGITVALAGTGGDELFGGYTSFSDVPKVTRYSKLLAYLPKLGLNTLSAATTQALGLVYGEVPPQVRWGKIADIFQVRGEALKAFQTSYSLHTNDFHNKLLTDENRYTVSGIDASLAQKLEKLIAGQADLSQVSIMELHLFIKERLMRDTDAASMAASLEVRVPLLDHVLLEKVSQLTLSQRFEPIGKKQLLRELAMPNIASELFDRPKSGFVLPFDRWCRDALRSDIASTLNDRHLCVSAGLNPEYVLQLYKAFNNGAKGIYWSRVWAIYAFLWWVRAYGLAID